MPPAAAMPLRRTEGSGQKVGMAQKTPTATSTKPNVARALVDRRSEFPGKALVGSSGCQGKTQGATITSGVGFLLVRKIDDRFKIIAPMRSRYAKIFERIPSFSEICAIMPSTKQFG